MSRELIIDVDCDALSRKAPDISIDHPFLHALRRDIDEALRQAVREADENNEITVNASIRLSVGYLGENGQKEFKPAEHKVKVNIKRESLQVTGFAPRFVAHTFGDRIVLADPDDDQLQISDLLK